VGIDSTAGPGTDPVVDIRPYEERDRAGLVDLWRRCGLTRPWNDPDLDIDRKLAVGGDLLLVAHDPASPIGDVSVGDVAVGDVAVGDESVGDGLVRDESVGDVVVGSVMVGYDGHRGWINYLAVDPGRRRRGIGERLMAVAEQRVLAVGCPKINLQIRRTNLGAVEFYRSHGFVDDEVTSMGERLFDDAPPSGG
jgi:ribosomal protein S18 acetylase RimI-like enzyme